MRRLQQRLRQRRQRGAANAVLIVVLLPALILIMGLVIDGGAQVSAIRSAENHADTAARMAADRAGAERVLGLGTEETVRKVVGDYLNGAGLTGTSRVSNGEVVVDVSMRYRTLILPMSGVVHASAQARLNLSGPDNGQGRAS